MIILHPSLYARRLMLVLPLVLMVLLQGCALMGPPAHSPGVAGVIDAIESAQASAIRVNGLGGLTLIDGPRQTRFRLGWAAEHPDHLRLVVLFSGRPIETLVYDGHTLSLVSHTGDHDPIITRRRNPNLEKLTTLPLTTDRIIAYLTGQVPIMPHRSAALKTAPGGCAVLTLFKRGGAVVQTIELDAEGRVTAFDIYDRKHTHHQVQLAESPSADGPSVTLPSLIRIDQEDRSLTIRVDQINHNPDLSADTFKIPSH